MVSPLPANVNLVQLLASAPGTAPTGVEPIESVQSGTSVALTVAQIVTLAKASFTVVGLSVAGVSGTASAALGAITATGSDQVLRMANATTLRFGPINLATSAAVTGTLGMVNGGVGTTALTLNGVLFGNATSTIQVSAAGGTASVLMANNGAPVFTTGTADQVFRIASNGTTLAFGAINIATTAAVTGVLPTANGGIGTSVVGQIPGTSTNDAASSGKIGEYISTSVVSGSARVLSSAAQTSVTSFSLSPGDWDVWGGVVFKGTATTTISYLLASIALGSTSSGTIGDAETRVTMPGNTLLFGGLQDGYVVNVGQVQQSLAATTTIWLTCQAAIGTSTLSAYGTFKARRRR